MIETFQRQPGWDKRSDLLSRLWSLSQVCRTQAATPEHSVTGPELVEIQRFKYDTVNALQDLADRLARVEIDSDEQGLVRAANNFRAIIDSVSAPAVQGEPVSGYG